MTDEKPERKAIDSSELEGMEVKDTDEETLGKVSSLQIDPESLGIAGIVVKRGFLDKDVLVGSEYIDYIDGDDGTVWLNVDLTLFIEGRDVVDSEGNVVGQVEEIDRVRETNTFKGLYVSGSEGEFYVDSDEIDHIRDDKVYLK
ncbi:MAG: PRC-barrel domain-containing protein [Halobacteria archaeon]|nr:PRC-barrel domain-containing protein [Halobacteria archaeon]